MPKIAGIARTDPGLKRDENQDSFLVDESVGLFLVADGMGGAASGRLAGRLVAESVGRYVQRYAIEDIENADRYDFYDPDLTPRGNTLMQAIHLANGLLYEASHKEDENRGMGATVAAVLTDDDHVLAANVGDSRIYRFRDDRLERLTVDHRVFDDPDFKTLVNPESTIRRQMGNTLTRAMGVRERVRPDLNRLPVHDGDIYLICSDGLTDMVDEEMIGKVLGMEFSIEKKAEHLVELALANGGRDNVTVVLAQAVSGRIMGLLKKITGD